MGMFNDAGERWKEYLSLVSGSWPNDDVRHNLGGEVRDRLRHLDLIMRHLRTAIDNVTPDPAELQKVMENFLVQRERFARGELARAEYIERVAPTTIPDPQALRDAYDDISIYTEAFYFCAWRMVEVLRGAGPYSFPGVGKIRASAITIVRNHLIQHPEKVKDEPNFLLGLFISSSGPVLRSSGGVFRGATGKMDPLPESKDQGLFSAAQELRDELLTRFDDAIAKIHLIQTTSDSTSMPQT